MGGGRKRSWCIMHVWNTGDMRWLRCAEEVVLVLHVLNVGMYDYDVEMNNFVTKVYK